MRYITEYRDKEKVDALAFEIRRTAGDADMTFMEVCGTHTMAIARFNLRSLLPDGIRLISGPGCPVCVTPNSYLDHAVALSRRPNTTICTFGDMIRVPGSSTSLEKEHAAGRDIRVVASTLDALAIARKSRNRDVVFLGIGFETTAPTIASSILSAKAEGIENYSILCTNKIVPPALSALLEGPARLDGFLLPGHVSTIIGAGAYREIANKSRKAGVIAGFEPTDILEGLLELVRRTADGSGGLHTSYSRAVSEEGNPKALSVMREVFEPCDASWRGLGQIPGSGLSMRESFAEFDAARRFSVEIEPEVEPAGCRCGEILTGEISPDECPLFGSACTTEHPIGACMVSSEGTCAARYRYRDT